MTDPTGRCFISYRRENAAAVRPVAEALHDLGVPVWQDVSHLGEVHTESELRRVIQDPATACAVLWITRQVASSPMIREVEAPLIHRRAEAGDGFFFVPVAVGGLDYRDAAEMLGPRLGVHGLTERNVSTLPNDLPTTAEALGLAGRVLRARLSAIHEHLPAGEPLRLQLDTREPSPFVPGLALCLDWLGRFPRRRASRQTWARHLLPALRTVLDAVRQVAPGRSLEVTGQAELPALLAFGVCASAVGSLSVSWLQKTAGVRERWSLEGDRQAAGFDRVIEPVDPRHRDLALLLSVTSDVEDGFKSIKERLDLRGLIRISHPDPPDHLLASSGEAKDLALLVRSSLVEARAALGEPRCIHLFASVPSGLALMIGQVLNTFSAVQTYQFLPSPAGSRYLPSVRLSPSS